MFIVILVVEAEVRSRVVIEFNLQALVWWMYGRVGCSKQSMDSFSSDDGSGEWDMDFVEGMDLEGWNYLVYLVLMPNIFLGV
jgi:hypothetical protein